MAQVVILGGYGRVGRLCAQEIAEQTRSRLVIAGPSIQKAESVALGLGGRAVGAYGNAADPRTLTRLLEGSRLLVACASDLPAAALDLAIGMRVSLIAVSSLVLGAARRSALEERAWRAQVPVVVHAGAIPGLPGVLADLLMRRFSALAELRIASTGPWQNSRGAARDLRQGSLRQGIRFPQRFTFPEPLGTLAVRRSSVADLEGFAAGHCVTRVEYLEPLRGLERWGLGPPDSAFSLVAEARADASAAAPDARIEIAAPDPLVPAAALAGRLAAGVLAGELPAGLLTPREALGPTPLLADLEKRGVSVRIR